MAKILNLDDMLAALQLMGSDSAPRYRAILEGAGDLMAAELAARTGLRRGPAEFQPGFGGTCAPFWPGGALPPGGGRRAALEVLGSFDPGGDWEPAFGPEGPAGAPGEDEMLEAAAGPPAEGPG